jgi:hypothetical protein
MHFGVIAAHGTAEVLLSALGAAGSFTAGGDIASFDDAPDADAAGERTLIAGDLDQRAYLLDAGLMLSTDPDLIVDASRQLSGPVVAAGAETTSGTYFLIAAIDGRLERCHWLGLGQYSKPYDVGEPLPGEPPDGLDDVDGQRLMGVLGAAGFDVDGWRDRGRKVVVDAAYGDPLSGPASDAMSAFLGANELPGADRIKPAVIRRDNGAYDLAAPGSRLPDGTRAGEPGERKPGLIGRLFGRD